MKRTTAVAALLLLAGAGSAQAQQAQQKASNAAAATMGMSAIYNVGKGYLLKTAEQLPEDKYGYRPNDKVRTAGQLIAHVADAMNFFCPTIAGTPKPYSDGIEKQHTSKAALTAALKQAFDGCDAVLAKITDADLAREVDLFGNKGNVAAAITLLSSHNFEHYGNLVTYMRENGMVPPSSQ